MKKDYVDLACLGGTPLFDHPHCVGRPNLCDREKMHAALDDLFDRRWLTNDGPLVRQFEERLRTQLGVKHAVAVCNATIGLQMVYRALGLPQGGARAVMPSFTFVATAHALAWEGGVPVFCDIDPATHLAAPSDMADRLDEQTAMLVGVHTWGQPCNIRALEALSQQHGIPLVFDAAHAFASQYHGRPIGGFGDAEVFSFHATKFINTFEGGAITTNQDALADELRYMRNFGFSGYDQVASLGTNGKMSEICAAMGLCMLDETDRLLQINRTNYRLYCEAFAGIDGISLLQLDEPGELNCQYIVATVDADQPTFLRDLLVNALWAENLLVRRYFYPGTHRAQPYARQSIELPATDAVSQRVLVFPTGESVSSEDIKKTAECIRFILENAHEIQSKL